MRVIAGTAKGRRLLVPRGLDVRPTADRVKESLFNILARDWNEATVLDLFSGTGNLAIEALSRGAARALLVDASARAAVAMRENLRRLGLEDRAEVWITPAARAIKKLASRSRTFTIIFLDPPYESARAAQALELIAAYKLLTDDGSAIVEHSSRDMLAADYGNLELHDRRQYGDTLLSFYRYSQKPIASKDAP